MSTSFRTWALSAKVCCKLHDASSDPMERVDELGDASVSVLVRCARHGSLTTRRVWKPNFMNALQRGGSMKVNGRKEFFRADIEIEAVILHRLSCGRLYVKRRPSSTGKARICYCLRRRFQQDDGCAAASLPSAAPGSRWQGRAHDTGGECMKTTVGAGGS
jgi:hypothetical protein